MRMKALRTLAFVTNTDKSGAPELARAGDAIEEAVKRVCAKGTPLTFDLVGTEHAAPMSAVTGAILAELETLL